MALFLCERGFCLGFSYTVSCICSTVPWHDNFSDLFLILNLVPAYCRGPGNIFHFISYSLAQEELRTRHFFYFSSCLESICKKKIKEGLGIPFAPDSGLVRIYEIKETSAKSSGYIPRGARNGPDSGLRMRINTKEHSHAHSLWWNR